ncbi:MAG: DUF6531 domain-containing protein [Opitutaceae bacterium]
MNLSGSAAFIGQRITSGGWNGWWRGTGYLLGSNLNGGGSNDMSGAITIAQANSTSRRDTETVDAVPLAKGADPVDLNTGAFLYETPGLALGGGSAPTGIDYRHFYSSARQLENPSGLGRGWTHSYDLNLKTRHPNDFDIRKATVAEVAPLIVAIQYLTDIATADPTAGEIALRALAANWAARQFKNSQAIVSLGERRIAFHRLPDGSYLQSSSIPATLARQSDGSHKLAFRHGNTISFRASDGKATTVVDPYGNDLALTYSDGRLYTVVDEYARTLTFSYTGASLTSVSDSTGRMITYGHSPNFTITDPENGATTFQADAFGRITLVTDARSRPIIFNSYDEFDRVRLQRPLDLQARQTEIGYAPGVAREIDAFGSSSWNTARAAW